MTRTTANRSTNLAALAMFAALAYYFGGSALSTMMHLQQQNLRFWGTTDGQAKFVEERVFRNVCANWQEMTFWERHVTYRDREWCAGYVDRL